MKPHYKFRQYRKNKSILYILLRICPSILLFFGSIYASYYINGDFFSDRALVISLIVAFFVEVVASNIERLISYEELAESIDDLHADVFTDEKFVVLKGSENIIDHVRREIVNATKVHNTFVGQSEIFFDDAEVKSGVQGLYQVWLRSERPQLWCDIVGRKEFFSGRYEQLYLESERENPPSVRVHVVSGGPPIANFMILTFRNGREAMYLGWSQARTPDDDEVIFTESREVIALYKSLFEGMRNGPQCWNPGDVGFKLDLSKTPEIPSRFHQNMIAEKQGLWVTVGVCAVRQEIVDVALVRIKYKNGIAECRVKVFNIDGSLPIDGERTHDMEFGHYMNRLVFETRKTKSKEVVLLRFRKDMEASNYETIVEGFVSGIRDPYRINFYGYPAGKSAEMFVAGDLWKDCDLETRRQFVVDAIAEARAVDHFSEFLSHVQIAELPVHSVNPHRRVPD